MRDDERRTASRATIPTPLSWSVRLGGLLIPVFVGLGLALGVAARAWMRAITVEPEFTVTGTIGIVLGFAFFGLMQAVAAIAAQRPWRPWPRRGARALGVVGLLPLFGAAGAIMAPAVILAGLAVWHPTWPRLVRWLLALVAAANVAAVSVTIVSDVGLSIRALLGVLGLVLLYSCIVWMAGGTFSRPRPAGARTRESRPA